MRSEIDDLAKLQHQDRMAIGEKCQAVGDDQHGAALRNALEIVADD